MGRQQREGGTPWDITTGVGLTALGAAAGRAIESDRSDGLVNDPYAETFVEAAGTQMPTRVRAVGDGDLPWESIATWGGADQRFSIGWYAEILTCPALPCPCAPQRRRGTGCRRRRTERRSRRAGAARM